MHDRPIFTGHEVKREDLVKKTKQATGYTTAASGGCCVCRIRPQLSAHDRFDTLLLRSSNVILNRR